MKKLLFGILIVSGFSGCLKGGNTFECNYNDCNRKAPASEIQSVSDYLTANNITATQHCSGLFYTINQQGSGANPTVCNSVSINYVGRLTNGTEFDRTTSQPLNIGLSELVEGFKNGLPFLKAGGKITLYIPPTLGYGNRQQGSIPPNSILIFNVDLLGVY